MNQRRTRPSHNGSRPQAPERVVVGAGARIGVVLGLVVALVAAGLVDRALARPPAASAARTALASVSEPFVESSAWYCAGGTAAAGSGAESTLSLFNTTSHRVSGTLEVVSDGGETRSRSLEVPAGGEVSETPGTLVGSGGTAEVVDLDGGGVLVSQSVTGPLGWSVSPCSRSTSPTWYFASGATSPGDTLTLSLFNPTATEAVVDTTFVTRSGSSQPQPFEGIVVAPGALVTEHLDSYVQDAVSVSSIVVARIGAVVAAELQSDSSPGARGLALAMGYPEPAAEWVLPRTVDLPGGDTSIAIFNPTDSTDRVELEVQTTEVTPRGDRASSTGVIAEPSTSPPGRFVRSLGPATTWTFDTNAQTRVPQGTTFLASVKVLVGPGVVVGRSVLAPSALGSPQFGGLDALSVEAPYSSSDMRVLPGASALVAGSVNAAATRSLDLVNWTSEGRRVVIYSVDRLQRSVLATLQVRARSSVVVGPFSSQAAQRPLVISADGPVSVLEDLGPSASPGVVSLAGAPVQ
ncbi:MAG: DUF5719 family protein [Acidimicrobiales bacterium]